jgi:tetratricopeptide (TPR) repeat protein
MAAFATRLMITLGATTIGLGAIAAPALAGDPFRSTGAKPIGNQTEAAFKALFKDGNYTKAKDLIKQAEEKEASEPLVYAMKAVLAFNDDDKDTFSNSATTTREKATQLISTDPMRGNLYTAVGNFLEGAAIVKKDGLVRGAVGALSKVQEAFKNLDAAEKIDAQDPELNLIKGNIDLMLAVNVKMPLSDTDKAIARLQGNAAPRYIADRSLAWGFRDLKKTDQALSAIDSALKLSPNNPELQYLKAQIFVRDGKDQSALPWFDKAIGQSKQLPTKLVEQITRERTRAQERTAAATPSPTPSASPAAKPSPSASPAMKPIVPPSPSPSPKPK